jgi:hypothetical protein
VISTPDQAVVPLGTPAVFHVTPSETNTANYSYPPYYPTAGRYDFSITVDFVGGRYAGTGVFEVNFDMVLAQPTPGRVNYRYLHWTGCLDPPDAGLGCGGPAGWRFGVPTTGPADPNSPALLMPFAQLDAVIDFGYGEHGSRLLTLRGTNPQRISEPATWLLLGVGLIVVRHRRRS